MNELGKPYNPKDHEEKIYKQWEESGYFNPDQLLVSADQRRNERGSTRRNFCMVIPPPNITGSLHMGHALNATIQDILVRYHRMKGLKTLWLPGTDHAGIATQYVVEKELKKEGLTRFDLGQEKFLERVWAWREKYGHIILEQFKKLGASCDWSRARFTLDADYTQAVETAFKHYYDKGLIYQADRVVNWCSRCATGLSDLEVEYQEEEAEWYEIKYGPLTIGTVRPETKLGDTAVAVNPQDPRYQSFIGQELEVDTVLGPAKMKVVADPEVNMEFGTGAMKVTPAHDAHDFELAEKYNLEKKQVIGPDGRMTALAGKYVGLTTKEARKQVVADLEKKGLLVSRKPYRHNVAVCYRCDTVIEPLISKQWFLKMNDLAKKARAEVASGRIKFYPENFTKTYFDWLDNIRDWAISRQIWWGHRLPIWFHEPICIPKPGREKDIEKCIEVVASSTEPECQFCNAKYIRSNEVLDTWFSSALWPFATLGWPSSAKATEGKPSDLERFYPTNVLTNDRGIINLWDARMIFSGLEFMGEKPFSDVLIHATVLTKDGQRMSKSLGTGTDPLKLIEEYGADATRFALIWQAMGGQDIRWQQEAVVAGKKFLNKIWNAARFVLGRNGISNSQFLISKPNTAKEENKEILKRFENTRKEVTDLIETYQFGQALHVLYDFFWHDFCDKYLEESKKLNNDETNQTLLYILAGSIKLLHPFIPFITEVIWGKLPIADKKLLIIENW